MSAEYLDHLLGDTAETSNVNNDIFSIEPVQLQFSLINLISSRINNNILVLAVKSGIIYRIDLSNPEVIDKIDLFNSSSGSGLDNGGSNKIRTLFQDPSGHHLIITTVKNVNYYLHKSSKIPIVLTKLKNMGISYVHWNDFEAGITDLAARNILLGTTSGQIFETSIEFKQGSNKVSNNFLKMVWKNPTNSGNHTTIDGIFMRYIRGKNSEKNEITLMVIIVQSDDIFYYKFPQFALNYRKNHPLFVNGSNLLLASNYTDYEKLDDIGAVIDGNKFISNGEDFAWITKSGIIFTSMNKNVDTKRLLTQLNYLLNIQLPESQATPTNSYSIVLTKHHIIYLRNSSELIIINKINQEISYHRYLPLIIPNEKYIGLAADYKGNTFWVYSNFNIYEIVITNENKDIWKIYLKNNEFDNALDSLEDGNSQDNWFVKDLILTRKADYLLKERKSYEKAAVTYGYTSKPFETVGLKLLELGQIDSLLKYLTIKLASLPRAKTEKFEDDEYFIQKTLLGSWIVELYMEKLNDLEESAKKGHKKSVKDDKKDYGKILQDLEKSLEKFLEISKDILDKNTIYQIFESHNCQKFLLFYGKLMKDYDFIINYWINLKNWDEVLVLLGKIDSPELIYKHANASLINSTEKTLSLWIKNYQNLNYKKFIPAILAYNREYNRDFNKTQKINKNPILKYLNFLIFEANAIDTMIHNIYLSILVMYPASDKKDTSEELILKYLERYNTTTIGEVGDGFGRGQNEPNEIYFDVDFILRLFLKFKKFKSAVYVYSIVKQYENSIELCLKYNFLKLACLIADRSFDDHTQSYEGDSHASGELRKRLWLKISEKMINKLILERVVKSNREILQIEGDSNAFENYDEKIHNIINSDKKFKEIIDNPKYNDTISDLINNDDEEIKSLLKYLLSKCELLSIKDLLPLFPSFQSINNFKLEIIKNLEAYGLKISQLNNLITNSIKFNQSLIDNLESLKISRYFLIQVENGVNSDGEGIVSNNSSCQICSNSIFLKKFMIFPCQHCFHIDCFTNFILNSSNKKNYKLKKSLLTQLKKNHIETANIKGNIPNESKNNNVKIGNNVKISKELEKILCSKCVLCSDLNIESIDETFIDDRIDKEIIEEWEL